MSINTSNYNKNYVQPNNNNYNNHYQYQNGNSPTERIRLVDFISKDTKAKNQSSFNQKEFKHLVKQETLKPTEAYPSLVQVNNTTTENLTTQFIEEKFKTFQKPEKKIREKTSTLVNSNEIKTSENKENTLKFVKLRGSVADKSFDNRQSDNINYAQDLTKKDYFDAGKLHIAKRLELYGELCKFIQNNKDELYGCNFPKKNNINEYAARQYVVPSKYSDVKIPYGSQRAHISLFNKIIVNQNNELNKIEGEILFKGTKISLNRLFNLCDITNSVINDIDGIMEFNLRTFGKDLLNGILKGDLTAEVAANYMNRAYHQELTMLTAKVSDLKSKIDINGSSKGIDFGDQQIENNMKNIVKEKSVSQYIDGMLKSAIFTTTL
ncbi:MAG: hypothetical protein H0V82_01185 [Candidatus Protochlamydia sp.]|nr:hypothetical protein [Candidatus Protochlamydia sp.]